MNFIGDMVRSPRMRRRIPVLTAVAVIVALAATALLMTGCAGELPVPGQTTTTRPGGSTTSTTESQTAGMAGQVAAAWQESIQKLVPLIQGSPPAASIQPQVAALKEQYVQKLVALGRQIAALQPYEQQAVYDRAMDALAGMGGAAWFTEYKNLYEIYSAKQDGVDQEFAVVLASFNTLTQYAFFDVLKEQEPAEAARLGIQ